MAQVFRKSALEKLSSPEQLDKAMAVTSPASWAVLIGAALIIAAAVVWGFLGRLPETVSAVGAVVGIEGSDCIIADSTGTITEFSVRAGDSIRAGDKIAVLSTASGKSRNITADRSGTVSMLLGQPGDMITGGTELLRLTPAASGERAVVFYVPAAQAQQMKNGMEAVVTISGTNEKRLSGKVISVSSGAVSVDNMALVLGAGNGMSDVFASQGPVYSVICTFDGDMPETGLVVSGKIIVEQSAPINRLLSGISKAAEG